MSIVADAYPLHSLLAGGATLTPTLSHQGRGGTGCQIRFDKDRLIINNDNSQKEKP
jgi:hypothetical protein